MADAKIRFLRPFQNQMRVFQIRAIVMMLATLIFSLGKPDLLLPDYAIDCVVVFAQKHIWGAYFVIGRPCPILR